MMCVCVLTAIFPTGSEERIAEFHRFALDFNSLLDEMVGGFVLQAKMRSFYVPRYMTH